MKALIGAGADICAQTESGWQPLHFAALHGHAEMAKVLIEAGAKIDAEIKDGRQAIHCVAQGGNTDVVKALTSAGADICAQTESGEQPLHLAASHGHAEMVGVLIEAGAKIDAADEDGDQAIHAAAEWGNIDTVKALIGAGADICAQTNSGLQPLHKAASLGNVEMVRVLVEAGAKVEGAHYRGYLVLVLAADLAKTLTDRGEAASQNFCELLCHLERDSRGNGNTTKYNFATIQMLTTGCHKHLVHRRLWHVAEEVLQRLSEMRTYLTELLPKFDRVLLDVEENPGLVDRLEQLNDVYCCAEAYLLRSDSVASLFCNFLDEHGLESSDELRSPESMLLLARLFCIFLWQQRDVINSGLRVPWGATTSGASSVRLRTTASPLSSNSASSPECPRDSPGSRSGQFSEDATMLPIRHVETTVDQQQTNSPDRFVPSTLSGSMARNDPDCSGCLRDDISELSSEVMADLENMMKGWTSMSVKQMVRVRFVGAGVCDTAVLEGFEC